MSDKRKNTKDYIDITSTPDKSSDEVPKYRAIDKMLHSGPMTQEMRAYQGERLSTANIVAMYQEKLDSLFEKGDCTLDVEGKATYRDGVGSKLRKQIEKVLEEMNNEIDEAEEARKFLEQQLKGKKEAMVKEVIDKAGQIMFSLCAKCDVNAYVDVDNVIKLAEGKIEDLPVWKKRAFAQAQSDIEVTVLPLVNAKIDFVIPYPYPQSAEGEANKIKVKAIKETEQRDRVEANYRSEMDAIMNELREFFPRPEYSPDIKIDDKNIIYIYLADEGALSPKLYKKKVELEKRLQLAYEEHKKLSKRR